MSSDLTILAGRFASQIRFEDLPEKAVETARIGFTDTIASLIAGLDEPVTKCLEAYVEETFGQGPVTCLLGRRSAAAEFAAMLDATAAHALDFDDYAFANHFSAVLVPTIFAAASIGQRRDGRAMVAAYAAGYEIWADLMTREPDHMHTKGWHPTAVLGPVAAAAAAAHMLGLDERQSANALALAASHSGGVMANFGSMAKPYHAGRAAAAGIRSALLTRYGVTAQDNALEEPRGLLGCLSPNGKVDLSTRPEFGTHWRVIKAGVNVKKYPTVGASQRCIDALLGLLKERNVDIAAIRGIRPRVSKKHKAVMQFDAPRTPSEAKFSLQFVCAAALRYGAVGLTQLTDEKLADPELQRLMAAVSVDAVEDYDPDYPVAAPFDIVTLTMADGSTIESPKIRRATGHADSPLAAEEHWLKFRDCADYAGVPQAEARRLFDAAQSIDTQTDLGFLSIDRAA